MPKTSICSMILAVFISNVAAYFRGPELLSWNAAEAYCVQQGSHLASIHDSTENIDAFNVCEAGGNTICWIGSNNNVASWTDGSTPSSFTDWDAPAPRAQYPYVLLWNGGWAGGPENYLQYPLCNDVPTPTPEVTPYPTPEVTPYPTVQILTTPSPTAKKACLPVDVCTKTIEDDYSEILYQSSQNYCKVDGTKCWTTYVDSDACSGEIVTDCSTAGNDLVDCSGSCTSYIMTKQYLFTVDESDCSSKRETSIATDVLPVGCAERRCWECTSSSIKEYEYSGSDCTGDRELTYSYQNDVCFDQTVGSAGTRPAIINVLVCGDTSSCPVPSSPTWGTSYGCMMNPSFFMLMFVIFFAISFI